MDRSPSTTPQIHKLTELSPGPYKGSLYCVPPYDIEQWWPFCAGFIRSAVEKTKLSNFAEVEAQTLSAHGLLWIVWDERIDAAVTTILTTVGDDKYCVLTACGGTGVNNWIPLLKVIEKYAKEEGCKALRIFGRKGWQRMLKDYDVTNIVLEKAL